MEYTHIAANGETNVFSGRGKLKKVVINSKGASSNVLTLYDNPDNAGQVIGVIDTTDAVGTLEYDIDLKQGLTAVLATGTAADITLVWEKLT